jgi:hypothetical protein
MHRPFPAQIVNLVELDNSRSSIGANYRYTEIVVELCTTEFARFVIGEMSVVTRFGR